MTEFFRYFSRYVYFLYAGIILFFSMLTIHSSVLLLEEHERIEDAYKNVIEAHIYEISDSELNTYTDLFELSGQIDPKKIGMYWSVVAMGLTGFVLVVLNADKLRKLEIKNEEKKRTLKLLEYRLVAMEASREGIGIIDSRGNLNYMNKALRNLHGIDLDAEAQFLERPWLNLYASQDQEEIKEHIIPELIKEGYWRGVSPIVRQNGEVIRAEMSLTKLSDGGFIGTARDITGEEKAAHEHKVMQDQFFQAQKMEAIGRLAGGFAHDFNNILAAMNGYAEFLVEDLEAGSQEQKFAVNILKAGRQARSLVDQILSFSRRETRETYPLDLCIPVLESISMLEASLPKTIEFRKEFNVIKAPILANATEITQVIMNLCVNAKDAMENDHGILTIGLDKVHSDAYESFGWMKDEFPSSSAVPPIYIEDIGPGHSRLFLGGMVRDLEYICLSIADTGSGMSRVIMEHVFEPFFTTKPVDQGTGLGLSIVHGIVSGCSAALMIDSVLEQGTRFNIYFPIGHGSEIQEVEENKIENVHTGRMVLLVDDQEEVRDMTQTMLSRLGYTVETACTGLEALEIIRENPNEFDFVVTDQNMPKMTGFELVHQVHIDFPNIPFVLLSGYSLEALEDLMREHPAIYAILRKPVVQKNLGEVLAQMFLKIKEQANAA